MNTIPHPLLRLTRSLIANALAVAVLGMALAWTPTAVAADANAPALPLVAAFEKGTPKPDVGPYSLTLRNASTQTVKASATIVLSIVAHSRPKTRDVPEHAIEAGKSWTIADLSSGDKVTIKAAGFAPLELTVP